MISQPTNAQQVMVTKLVTLTPEMHVADGIARLLKFNITGAPVVDDDRNFLGVFSEKCCMKVLGVMARTAQEDGNDSGALITAKDFMVSKLISLSPDTDVMEAIGLLLKNRISGAPVLDSDGKFIGSFSEKNSMDVLIASAYEQFPTTQVGKFMNPDLARIISADADLFEIAQKFVDTPLRRFEVVDEKSGKLMGQISRRDVLRAEQRMSKSVRHRVKAMTNLISDESDDANNESSDVAASPSVAYFMDRNAKTITEELDFLGVARIFLDTPYRRLPVLTDGKVVGQISRRDVLQAVNELISIDPPPREKTILYLSSLVDRQDAPFG